MRSTFTHRPTKSSIPPNRWRVRLPDMSSRPILLGGSTDASGLPRPDIEYPTVREKPIAP